MKKNGQEITIKFLFGKWEICQTNYPEKADMVILISNKKLRQKAPWGTETVTTFRENV